MNRLCMPLQMGQYHHSSNYHRQLHIDTGPPHVCGDVVQPKYLSMHEEIEEQSGDQIQEMGRKF